VSFSEERENDRRDAQLVGNLLALWAATRRWAEGLLVDTLGLATAKDILQREHRGSHAIPGTEWQYRTHGVGVDITSAGNRGGIDFDFDEQRPDSWRLRDFLVKQYNAGNLTKREYRPLLQSQDRWERAYITHVELAEARTVPSVFRELDGEP
jgi:hypothetical protein